MHASLLNLFASTNHIYYAKSGRLYVQEMETLSTKHPELYKLYTEFKMHIVQRTSHSFNGLSTDLIEQALMKVLKCRGGLTHGRGMTKSVRLQWVNTMSFFVSIHNAMVALTGKDHTYSYEHVEFSTARRKRDAVDIEKLINWFHDNNPHADDITVLKSKSSGLVSQPGDGVNCDQVDNVGRSIQLSLYKVAVADAKIKKMLTIKILEHLKPGIKLNGKMFHVSPEILFLRCVSRRSRNIHQI